MYSKRCPDCGAYLDPGEACGCNEEAASDGANIESGTGK